MKKQISAIFIVSIMMLSLTAFAHETGEAHVEGAAEAQVIGDQSAQLDFQDTTVTEAEIQTAEEEFKDTGLLPDHPFYGFKRFGEDLGVFFAFDNTARAKIHLELAKKRLSEAKALLEKNEEKLAEKALEEQDRELNKSKERREELKALGKNVSELTKETDDILQKSILVLELVKEKLPEKTQLKIEAAIKKQIEYKVRAHKENTTTEDIKNEERYQERVKSSMYERLQNRFENKLDRIDKEIMEAELKNNTEKIEKLTEMKNRTIEQKERAEENLEKLREKAKEITEKRIEKINEKLEKTTDKFKIVAEGNLSSDIRVAIDNLSSEIQTRTEGEIKIEVRSVDGNVSVKIEGNLTENENIRLENLKNALSDSTGKVEIKMSFTGKSEKIENLEERKNKIEEKLNKTLERIGIP